MLQFALIGAVVGVASFALWYILFVRFNHNRGLRVLHWLQDAIAEHGQVTGVAWMGPSHFRARLNLSGSAFHQPFFDVRLAPRHIPVRWALWSFSHRQETITFQANLSCPPSEGLEIGRTRWFGLNRRTNQGFPHGSTRRTIATLYISTQPAWEPQLSSRIHGVVATRDFDFLSVSFRTRPPHFSVSVSLQETLRHRSGELAIFENLRELAEGSPTSRM
jgi:hypothetical protein